MPEEVFAVFADGDVGVHAAAIHADYRLRQEASSEPHVGGDLAANQFVKLNLVGGGDHFTIAVVDLELRRRDFRVVFLVLETHGSLHFGGSINKRAQRIAGECMVVTAGIDVFEFAGFVVTPLRVLALEKESFDFIGGVECVAFFLVEIISVALQHSPDVSGVRRTVFVNHVAEDQNFAGAEDIRRRPIKRSPIHRQPQVALALRGEPPNRGTVERQIIPAFDQKLLVVIEHVQAAFEVAEQHGHGFDALFIRQILEAFFLNLVFGNSFLTLLLGFQIQLLQLIIGKGEKISQFVRHESPQSGIRLKLGANLGRQGTRRPATRVSRGYSERQSKDLKQRIQKSATAAVHIDLKRVTPRRQDWQRYRDSNPDFDVKDALIKVGQYKPATVTSIAEQASSHCTVDCAP